MGSGFAPRDPAGRIINDPSDGKLPQITPAEILLPQESFPASGPNWNTTPNPDTPKRYAPDSPRFAPGPRVPRADASSGSEGDQEFPSRHAASPPASYLIAVTTEHVRLAGREPARGWPPYSVLKPDGDPAEVIHDPVSNPKNFRGKAASEGRVTGTAMDPIATALKAARAALVGPGEFRALGGHAALLRPPMGIGFQV